MEMIDDLQLALFLFALSLMWNTLKRREQERKKRKLLLLQHEAKENIYKLYEDFFHKVHIVSRVRTKNQYIEVKNELFLYFQRKRKEFLKTESAIAYPDWAKNKFGCLEDQMMRLYDDLASSYFAFF